jgi:hypothetical protein
MGLDVVKISNGEYALTIIMVTNKGIFNSWIKHCMCMDYYLVNKQTRLDKYILMPLLEGIFDVLGKPKCLALWIFVQTTINCH